MRETVYTRPFFPPPLNYFRGKGLGTRLTMMCASSRGHVTRRMHVNKSIRQLMLEQHETDGYRACCESYRWLTDLG